MRKILLIITLLCLSLASCNNPRRIPDKKLSLIVRDVIIANAYVNLYLPGAGSDSTDFYTPILAKYGYDDADLRYTLGEMAMKKSSRLSSIIEAAQKDIEMENNYFKERKRVERIIDSVANEKFKDTVYAMDTSSIVIKRFEKDDVEKYSVRIPAETEGSYGIKMRYIVDSTDKKNYYSMRYFMADSLDRSIRYSSYTLSRGGYKHVDVKISAHKDGKDLVIRLVNYYEDITKPFVTFDSIYVIHYLPEEKSRLRLAESSLNYRFRDILKDVPTEKDSITLRFTPPFRADTTRNTNF